MQEMWVPSLEEGMPTHSCSYLEDPMGRGAWRITVHAVTKELAMTECTHTHTPWRTCKS